MLFILAFLLSIIALVAVMAAGVMLDTDKTPDWMMALFVAGGAVGVCLLAQLLIPT